MPNATVRANARTMPIDRRGALRLFVAAPASIAAFAHGTSAAADNLDLLALGAEFDAALQREKAAYASAGERDEELPESELSRALDAATEVVDRIIATPARDLSGCKLKARAYLWCYGGDAEDALGCLRDKATTTDCKLIHALMRDLLDIA